MRPLRAGVGEPRAYRKLGELFYANEQTKRRRAKASVGNATRQPARGSRAHRVSGLAARPCNSSPLAAEARFGQDVQLVAVPVLLCLKGEMRREARGRAEHVAIAACGYTVDTYSLVSSRARGHRICHATQEVNVVYKSTPC